MVVREGTISVCSHVCMNLSFTVDMEIFSLINFYHNFLQFILCHCGSVLKIKSYQLFVVEIFPCFEFSSPSTTDEN